MASRTVFVVGVLLVSLGLFGCSSDPPSARVLNERTTKANVQIKFADGNTININDVAAGTATAFQEIHTGTTMATATIQSESVAPSGVFNAEEDKNYTLVVVNSTPPTLRIDVSDK
jgi:hypothetical protein